MDKSPKDQLATRIKDASNVLVTVSTNPSVDQLAAAIGFTLFLSKLKKHATTVFSGAIPSTLEFLKPEDTIEETTDSLQDFIIALDKSKADKIRYKVEDQMVKIFITPYRSSIDEADLQFSKGDFNVDVVVAVGVHRKEELDQAITAHGRILHDATVATINLKEDSELGAINWTDPQASSLCEMVVVLADMIKTNAFDAQIATALLTGIVAETERFSNEKTSSNTMNASAKLMAAGANQQLVASKLDEPPPSSPLPRKQAKDEAAEEGEDTTSEEDEDGSLRIAHDDNEPKPPRPSPPKKKPEPEPKPSEKPPQSDITPPLPPPEPQKPLEQIEINKEGQLAKKEPPEPSPPEPILPPEPPTPQIKPEPRKFLEEPPASQRHEDTVIGGPAGQSITSRPPNGAHIMTEPPSLGGKLSAMSEDFHADEGDETPLTLPPVEAPILTHDSSGRKQTAQPSAASVPEPPPVTTPNLSQAAEPAPAIPAPFPVPPPSLAPKAPPPPPEPPQPKSKLPSSFISTLDESTLKELERKTGSPHQTQAAANLDDKTLQAIEKSVGSHHKTLSSDGAKPSLAPTTPAEPAEDTALAYELHESEPPEKTSKPSAKSPKKAPAKSKNSSKEPEKSHTELSSVPPPPRSEPSKSRSAPSSDTSDTSTAREAVIQAINSGGNGGSSLPPLQGLGTTDAGINLSHDEATSATSASQPIMQKPSPNIEKIDDEGMVTFASGTQPPLPTDHTATSVEDPTAPPPVPPPMMPPTDQSA